jgi:NAD(P)-dependent dehydrogenase (short-subunit alcohol dehydrogenase family)
MIAKIIVVTGAYKGIGFEITRQLAKAGHTLVLTARTLDKANKAAETLLKSGFKVHPYQLDVTDSESIQSFHDDMHEYFGKIDVLINNAGILMKDDHDLLDMDKDTYRKTIAANAEGPLMLTQKLVDLFIPGSSVINISSGGGSMSDPVGGWSPAYCISKSYLNAITRHLAYYLADKGVKVNAMDPGWVRTDMGGASAPGSVEEGADTAVWLATIDKPGTGLFYRDRRSIPW